MTSSAPYAIVDVETTYGDPRHSSIMEVAVVLTDGEAVLEQWSSLIDPQGPIDRFVSALTGITPSMVAGAPRFSDVAVEIDRLTRGATLVAHNARFDSTALSTSFARCGLVFERDTLCTEQLSRRFFPFLKFHNLNSLCRHMGLPMRGDHRALRDALACKAAFSGLLARFGTEQVRSSALAARLQMRA